MALTEQQLISWSRDIRDVLAGRVKQSDGSCIDQEMTMTFNAFFSTLLSTEMSLDIFRKTRIHFALLEIITKDSGWPEGLQKVARLLVDKWERLFGTLEEIEADPWAEGGRMYGVYKLVDFRKLGLESNTVRKNEASEECGSEAWGRKLSSTWEIVHLASWSIQGSKGDPFRVGHIGFNVGDWWIKPATAYRDGIIHKAACGITANTDEAFAIVITREEEQASLNRDTIEYTPSVQRGRSKLLRNILTRSPVRVLRDSKLKSINAPKAGLRYDGLYYVIGWGVRANNDKAESLKYSFELGRMPVQLSMEQSRHKPSAEQMDDWRTYKKYKNVRVKDINQSNPNDKAVIVSWGSRDSSISSLRRDSGYSSEPKRRSSRSVNSSGSKEAM